MSTEDVFDSWEDIIDENGDLDKKLSHMTIGGETRDNACLDTTRNCNDNCNSIKILKRPSSNTSITNTNSNTITSTVNLAVNDSLNSLTNSNANTNCNSNQCQTNIVLEDNTRSQYVPQVRILKRPNGNKNNISYVKNATIENKATNNMMRTYANSKTYEEREAEYAKARLRILGSASAQEDSNSSVNASDVATDLCQVLNSTQSPIKFSNNNTTNINNDVPIIRLPIGPDGSKGFASKR